MKNIENMNRSELMNMVADMTDIALQKMLNRMAEDGGEYTLSDMNQMTEGFISRASIKGFLAHNTCTSISNGGRNNVHTPRNTAIRNGNPVVHQKRYVNIDNPNDIITLTRKETTYCVR